MRAANGKLFVAENGSGKISRITVNGEKASVTVIKGELKTPTESNLRATLWIAERGPGKAVLIPMPKSFVRFLAPLRIIVFDAERTVVGSYEGSQLSATQQGPGSEST